MNIPSLLQLFYTQLVAGEEKREKKVGSAPCFTVVHLQGTGRGREEGTFNAQK
jgi:hypothetical protein